ncbi:GNAT family N-acetyltransferase [Scandinavium sp. TWS1a]|uniref:GNAT family N-acetyltransferase n=1 Tax=Scandinavium tedordense TaxID=2926521 RepID=UPI002166A531|nr:GNAT family N-acetyltransferase [Scandinavium tedordense]MCS2170624.1 GNAT family N-acetyltransferase [Scandinavium tedordense]
MPVLLTSRLRLSPMSENDWPCFLALRSDPQVMRFMGVPLSEAELRLKFSSRLSGHVFAIHDREGECVGDMGLQVSTHNAQEADIGYALLPQAQGKGYAQEALAAICEYGFSTLGLQAINAWVLADNDGSVRLLEKLGFVRTQVLEKAFEINGELYDDWVYRLER